MKFRPQFGLRTLLLVVTAAAVLCWAYWIGWPWWRDHAQQSRFVDAVRQLKVGMLDANAELLGDFEGKHTVPIGAQFDQSNAASLIIHHWSDATYCIYWVQAKPEHVHLHRTHTAMVRIELYRLPPAPAGYRSTWMSEADAALEYQFDFLHFLNGDRKNNPGFKYELIYADPPQKR